MARRGRKPDLERRRRAAELRAQGLTFTEVGRRLGVTRQAAQSLVRPRLAATASCASCGAPVPWGGPRCLACVTADPAATFPERLQACRLAGGLTQAQLAAQAGLSHAIVANYERGRGRPRARRLAARARVLGTGLLAAGPPIPELLQQGPQFLLGFSSLTAEN